MRTAHSDEATGHHPDAPPSGRRRCCMTRPIPMADKARTTSSPSAMPVSGRRLPEAGRRAAVPPRGVEGRRCRCRRDRSQRRSSRRRYRSCGPAAFGRRQPRALCHYHLVHRQAEPKEAGLQGRLVHGCCLQSRGSDRRGRRPARHQQFKTAHTCHRRADHCRLDGVVGGCREHDVAGRPRAGDSRTTASEVVCTSVPPMRLGFRPSVFSWASTAGLSAVGLPTISVLMIPRVRKASDGAGGTEPWSARRIGSRRVAAGPTRRATPGWRD